MKKYFILVLFFILSDFSHQKYEVNSSFKDILKMNDFLNFCESRGIDHLSEIDMQIYQQLEIKPFESFETNDLLYMTKMKVSETNNYEITTEDPIFSFYVFYALYDEDGKLIVCSQTKGNMYAFKGDIIYGVFIQIGWLGSFKVSITPKNIKYHLPFDPINIIDESKFNTRSISTDPLKPAEVKYKKRTGNFIYINSNNPEIVNETDINKAFIRLDISNKEVFFTFEHNTKYMKIYKIYSGFRVKNIGTKDLKVIIKNIGFQYNGNGYFLGQKEWIDFYNMKFKILNRFSWTDEQKNRFESLFNFDDKYEPTPFEETTYIIPPGEYFYVIGGTTKDAYNNINVFNTADINVAKTVINGVVIFEVIGNAEGAYYFYDNIKIPQTDNKSYLGYVYKRNDDVGKTYLGYDNCHGVIDNSMTWEFNDLTKEQYLPVYYKVNYKEGAPLEGQKAFSKIPTTEHIIYSDNWVTHLNPHKFLCENMSICNLTEFRAVGKDMTKYITIDEDGNNIIIDDEHYDGRGILSNIGNWMIDYIDNFNFVNRGDKERKINVLLGHGKQGSLACFVRNSKLDVIEGTQQNTIYCPDTNSSIINDSIKDIFNYTFKVSPHSVLQIYVEYNLLANSFGNVTHSVYLGKFGNSSYKISSGNNINHYLISLLISLLLI